MGGKRAGKVLIYFIFKIATFNLALYIAVMPSEGLESGDSIRQRLWELLADLQLFYKQLKIIHIFTAQLPPFVREIL